MSKIISVPIIFNNENSLKYNQELIKDYIKNMKNNNDFPKYGEIIHDSYPDFYINSNNISHEIKDVSVINNDLYADINVLDTPSGKLIQDMITENFSINAVPRLIIDGNNKDNCQLISIDLNIT